MSLGRSPSPPPAAPPPPPPPTPAPDAPEIGDAVGRRRAQAAKRTGTRSLRTDLMIVPGGGERRSLNIGD